MDTIKTGAFIRERRKEQNMTQKDLADRLGITDRAVSKWERGINAPDLSTLEPLSKLLGVTITELIAGERAENKEEDVKAVLTYSAEQTARTRRAHRRVLVWVLATAALAAAMVCAVLWLRGVFSVAERSISPDGQISVTVYSRDIADDPLTREQRVTVREDRPGDLNYTAVYGGTFGGLWWAPDASAYILTMETAEGPRTLLIRPGTVTELDTWLRLLAGEGEYRFCRWAEDSDHMLIRYIAPDGTAGYFWYSRGDGSISGRVEF